MHPPYTFPPRADARSTRKAVSAEDDPATAQWRAPASSQRWMEPARTFLSAHPAFECFAQQSARADWRRHFGPCTRRQISMRLTEVFRLDDPQPAAGDDSDRALVARIVRRD